MRTITVECVICICDVIVISDEAECINLLMCGLVSDKANKTISAGDVTPKLFSAVRMWSHKSV